jgi:hypothetical protein
VQIQGAVQQVVAWAAQLKHMRFPVAAGTDPEPPAFEDRGKRAPVIVAVHHDHAAEHAGSPRSRRPFRTKEHAHDSLDVCMRR